MSAESQPDLRARVVDLDDPRRLAAAARLLRVGADNSVLTRLAVLAAQVLSTASAQVSLVTSTTSVLAGHGVGGQLAGGSPLAREESLCARVVADNLPLLVGQDTTGLPAAASYLGVPLRSPEGLPVGAVCVYDEQPRGWLEHDVRVAEALAAAVGAELERVAAETEANGVEREMVALMSAASNALAASLDAGAVIRSLARLAVPALADFSVVTLLDESGEPQQSEWWHRDSAQLKATAGFARRCTLGRAESARATLTNGEVIVVAADVLAEGTPSSQPTCDALTPGSAVVVPIANWGRLDGTVVLAREAHRAPMAATETAVARDLGRRASVALSYARRYDQHRTTSELLQRSLLTAPVVPAGTELEVRYLPATDHVRVGGDWYDAFALPDRSTALVVGDVAGHDVAAAAAMGQVRSILRGLAVTSPASAGAVLDRTDEALDALRSEVQATALVCRLGPVGEHGAELACAGAGHVPGLVLTAEGGTRLLDTGGVMLGVGSIHSRRDRHTWLAPGDTLLLLTDGLVERRESSLDAGLSRLRQAVASRAGQPLPRLVDEVLEVMLADGHEDDVALLAVRVGQGQREAAV